jgi:hypothetical protein
VHDFSVLTNPIPGAYKDGFPILQGVVYYSDGGIGDNAFRVTGSLIAQTTPQPTASPTETYCGATNARISSGKTCSIICSSKLTNSLITSLQSAEISW